MWGKQSTFENLKTILVVPNPSDGSVAEKKVRKEKTSLIVTGLKSYPLASLVFNAQASQAQALFLVNHDETDVNSVELPAHLPGSH